jgi:hypothetical protein
MYKLTLKKAEGYIKSRKVVISLEYHAEQHWWVRYSWFSRTPKFFTWFYFADRYFNKLVRKHGLKVEWMEDKDEVAEIIKVATKK